VRHPNGRGQSLVEFALVFPVLVLAIGGVIQAGTYFWAQSTLEQVAHDLGRWAVTQRAQPCSSIPDMAAKADGFANSTNLIGHASGEYTTATYRAYADGTPLPATAAFPRGVEAAWTISPVPSPPVPCPAPNNAATWFVTIRLTHTIPVFFPLLPIPSAISVTTTTQMEPTT
jgi:Flp pilus assembly protein TadG